MKRFALLTATACTLILSHHSNAQPPEDRGSRGGRFGEEILDRILSRDTNDDGVLEKSEVADTPLERMFDRADEDGDGKLTREEILAGMRARFGNRGPGGGRPLFGPGGPPKPGTILPEFLQDALELDVEQREKLEELQEEVNARLKEILSPAQWARLESGEGLFPGRRGPRGGDDRGQRRRSPRE